MQFILKYLTRCAMSKCVKKLNKNKTQNMSNSNMPKKPRIKLDSL